MEKLHALQAICFCGMFMVQSPSLFADTNKVIAVQFFPENLKSKIIGGLKREAVDLSKYVMVEPADLDGTGQEGYLVCVYSDRAFGALRVIKVNGAGPTLVAEAPEVELYGVRGGPSLIDLDGDKIPEIDVQFMSSRGNDSTWIFKWTGSSLKLVSPVSGGLTDLGSVEYFDLTGDGKVAVVTQSPIRPTRDDEGNVLEFPTGAFVLSSSGLTLVDSFFYQRQFTRKSSKPKEVTNQFSIEDISKNYVLKVVDLNMSKPDLGPLTSSAEITLNGDRVVSPNLFNPGTRKKMISVPVKLKGSNEIKVKLAGEPGSKILVTLSELKK